VPYGLDPGEDFIPVDHAIRSSLLNLSTEPCRDLIDDGGGTVYWADLMIDATAKVLAASTARLLDRYWPRAVEG
jgi:hypothetical protein